MTTKWMVAVIAVLSVAVAVSIESPRAAVPDASDGGFTVRHEAVIAKVAPADVYAALLRVGDWWNKDHTWSGDAHNLALEARAGGCFCETLPGGGSVRHMVVVFVAPGKMLRLAGGLGPLQGLAVSGSMTWEMAATPAGTTLRVTYTVGGYRPGGLKELAPVVDTVIGEQFGRLVAMVTPKP